MSARRASRTLEPPFESGEGHVAEVALGREAVDQESVAHLSCDLGHELADAGDEYLRAFRRGSARD